MGFDLKHAQLMMAILGAVPGDTDLPHAIIALEDAMVCCQLAFRYGITLDAAREIHREAIVREESRRLKLDSEEKPS